MIVSSVELQWMRPSYTGSRGVSVKNYTVTANGGTVVVSDDSEVVSYTSPSLICGVDCEPYRKYSLTHCVI